MNTVFIKNLKLLLAASLIFFSNDVLAQTDVAAVKTNEASEALKTVLITVAVVLVFVIWGLTQVVLALAKMVQEKQQKMKLPKTLMVAVLLLASNQLWAQDTADATVVVADTTTWGLSHEVFYALTIVLGAEIIIIALLTFLIRNLYNELTVIPGKEKIAEENKWIKWLKKFDQKQFTKAVPVEREADVMLDHDYDGIRELDNALPPWWKYGFYITIVVGIIYLLNFHVLEVGQSPEQEYIAEMDKAQIEKEKYEAMNKDKIDEEKVPMADEAGIVRGEQLYHAPGMCSSCHGNLGEGGAGPNLTDDYWIHKGSLNDIYKSIKYGYPDKGMQSWEKNFTPKEISYLSSYIKTLRGTNPPGAQPPKGDLYIENKTDSTIANVTSGL
ncbi:MAG: c-type cytochrome [Bacteroidetes bacterium]|nr:c-type cytochrome [Bacteroidota bacterium]